MTMLKVTVVESFHQEGGLSLRAWSEEKGRLSATALKSGLKEAGFKAGDLAYIVTAQDLADFTTKTMNDARNAALDAAADKCLERARGEDELLKHLGCSDPHTEGCRKTALKLSVIVRELKEPK